MKSLSTIPLAIGLMVLASIPSRAEQADQVETRISVLAIGNPPQPRYVIRDDRRHLLDTLASEHPPSEVMVREKRGETESFKTVPLGLNSPTGTITYRGERKLVLMRQDNGGEPSEFVSLTLPDLKNDLAIFLLRNRKAKSWEKEPQVHYFDNGLAAFPNDSVRLINLSAVPIRAQINEGRVFQLAVARSTVIRIPRQDQGVLGYRIAAVANENIIPLIDTATTTMPDTRFNIIVYNSDSANARMPVDIASYFERPHEKKPE